MPSDNRALLIRCARALDGLTGELVFVGGSITDLLITDAAAAEVRPTLDVDAITEVTSLPGYYALGQRLKRLGFSEDRSLLCRWRHKDQVTLDVMPTNERILGFSNQWYPDAIAHAILIEIEPGLKIRVVTAPYFCATKIVAFHGRGEGDYIASHDLEDFVTVVDGRQELAGEIRSAAANLREYLAEQVRQLLSTREFAEALPGFLRPDPATQARLPLLMQRLEEVALLA